MQPASCSHCPRIVILGVLLTIIRTLLFCQADLTTRIERVEKGLFSGVRVKGDTGWTIHERMTHYRIPGVSIAVINNCSMEWAKAYGVANAELKEQVTSSTLFQAGSISKPVAAAAALREVERGKLSLNENMNTYLRSWKLPENELTSKNAVTLSRILSHSAGTTVHGFPGYPQGFPLPTIPQILDGIAPGNTDPVRVRTEPGRGFNYSGGGYVIMQLAMTDVEQKPFPEIMRELVLDPLGMKNSTYEQPLPEPWREHAASGHNLNGDVVDGKYYIYPEMAAAGLWTTPTDLASFIVEIQRSYAGKSDKILSKEMTRKMLTPLVDGFMGVGVFLDQRGEALYFAHNGSDEGFNADFIAHAEKGYGAVVMVNSDNWQLSQEIFTSIAREYQWEDFLSQEYTPTPVDPAKLDMAVGRFKVNADRVVAFTREGDNLFVQIPPLPRTQLFALAYYSFIRKDQDVRYEFIPSSCNRPTDSVKVYTAGGRGRTFPRIGDSIVVPSELLAAGKLDDAITAYRKIQQADSNSAFITRERFNAIGYSLAAERKFTEAIAAFQVSAVLHPSLWNAFDALGDVYWLSGDRQKSLEAYKKSLTLNPRSTKAMLMIKKFR